MEVKQLSQHLSHFPALFPSTLSPTVLEGVAARALGEAIPKQGYSCKNATNDTLKQLMHSYTPILVYYPSI